MAIGNSSSLEIGSYLFRVEREAMECPSTLERCIIVADKIIEVKKKYLG